MSEHGQTAPRAAWRRLLPRAVIALCVAAGSFALVLVLLGNGEARLLVGELSHAPAPSPPTSAAQAAPPVPHLAAPPVAPPASIVADPKQAKSAEAKPQFDIVRVGRDGTAVVAGRAAPNADVAISDNGRQIGHARADAAGDWVIVPQASLPAGGRELTLASRAPDGAVVQGDAPVLVIVPAQQAVAVNPAGGVPAPSQPPLVLLTPQDAPPSLLQPAVSTVEPLAAGGAGPLGLDVVDYDEAGAIRFAGRGPDGAALRIYIDDAPAGDAHVAGGRWSLTPPGTVAPGAHRLRVDQIAASGKVGARIELPFRREAAPPEASAANRIVVQPGQSLWALARRSYGEGVRYTVIYEANKGQIRDPDLIYPGQVFAVPAASPPR